MAHRLTNSYYSQVFADFGYQSVADTSWAPLSLSGQVRGLDIRMLERSDNKDNGSPNATYVALIDCHFRASFEKPGGDFRILSAATLILPRCRRTPSGRRE